MSEICHRSDVLCSFFVEIDVFASIIFYDGTVVGMLYFLSDLQTDYFKRFLDNRSMP